MRLLEGVRGSPAHMASTESAPHRTIGADDRPVLAVILVVSGCALLTFNDAFMKDLVTVLPLAELVALRAFFGVLACIATAAAQGRMDLLRPRNPRNVLIVSLLLLGPLFMFPFSLRFLPLAEAIILAYLSPILVTAMAPFVLGEQVGWRRWSAVIVGFLGAGLVIDPTGGAIQPAVALPLIVALLVAFRDAFTRRIIAGESTLALALGASLGAMVVGGLAAPFEWVAPTWPQLGMIAVAGTLITTSQMLVVAAFRRGDAVLVSSFKYTSIIWAALLGYLIWGEALDLNTWIGSALIVASGIFIVGRTRRKQRQRPPDEAR